MLLWFQFNTLTWKLPSTVALHSGMRNRAQPPTARLLFNQRYFQKAKVGQRVHVSQQSDLSCLFKDQKDVGRLKSGWDKQQGCRKAYRSQFGREGITGAFVDSIEVRGQIARPWESCFSLAGPTFLSVPMNVSGSTFGTWWPHEDTVLVRKEERLQDWSWDKLLKALETAPGSVEAGR